MKVTVKNPLYDTLSFILHLKKRNRLFKKAATRSLMPAPMNLLAGKLHPRTQVLRITGIRQETPSARTYRLGPVEAGGRAAFFRAGQYIAVEEIVGGVPVSRPFSISSSPEDAAENNFYEITIKTGNDGFFAPWSLREWTEGRILQCSEPTGTFYYESLRDTSHVVCLAGGSGITPFRSILKDSLSCRNDVRFTLFYGAANPEEMIFGSELEELQSRYPDRFSLVKVFSGSDCHAARPEESARPEYTARTEFPGSPAGAEETGFITAKLIKRHCPDAAESSFFICGPREMYDFVSRELEVFSLSPGRLRKENYGGAACGSAGDSFVNGSAGDSYANGGPEGSRTSSTRPTSRKTGTAGRRGQKKIWTITVLRDSSGTEGTSRERETVLPADETETVLTALERAGLNPPALCRSGECGWCRSRLAGGEIYVSPENDRRRQADLKFGWFHPCSSYPRSDLIIEVPRNPLQRRYL